MTTPATQPADAGWKARPEGSDYEATRMELIDAAESIILTDGIAALRPTAVAKQAGLSRSSMYRYFDSKEELVIAVVVRSTLRLGQRVIEGLGDDAEPARFLVDGIIEALRALAEDPLLGVMLEPSKSQAMSRLTNSALRQGVRPLVEPVFAAAAERGVLRSEVSPDDAVRWLQVVALGLLQSPTVTDSVGDLAQMLELMLVPALINPAG